MVKAVYRISLTLLFFLFFGYGFTQVSKIISIDKIIQDSVEGITLVNKEIHKEGVEFNYEEQNIKTFIGIYYYSNSFIADSMCNRFTNLTSRAPSKILTKYSTNAYFFSDDKASSCMITLTKNNYFIMVRSGSKDELLKLLNLIYRTL